MPWLRKFESQKEMHPVSRLLNLKALLTRLVSLKLLI
jgi:hypothetical protein